MSVKNLKIDEENILNKSPAGRSPFPPNQSDISNSTTKRFNNVVEQYMRVHKISSLNPAVVTQAADYTGLQGDSYHQWDEYNPPSPTTKSRAYYDPQIASDDKLLEMRTPSMIYEFDHWSVGDTLQNAKASTNKDRRDPSVGTTISTPTVFIQEESSLNEECSSSDKTHKAEATGKANHLQLSGISPSRSSHVSMTSFWNDYERTANGFENTEFDHTPMRYLNYDGSQNQGTSCSDLSNSAFESQIDTVMEPDSLEKKPIGSEEAMCDLSAKNSRHSKTVAFCLPHLLMSEYTESPPYMPSECFNYDVTDNGGTQQRRDINSDSNSGRLRTSQRNVQHAEVFDSLADYLEEKENRRYTVIGIRLMIIGALMHIIGLIILVCIQNKKFAPYNGIYPNGCRDVMLLEGAMTAHGVNCSEILAQEVLNGENEI